MACANTENQSLQGILVSSRKGELLYCSGLDRIDAHCGGCASHCFMHSCPHPAVALSDLTQQWSLLSTSNLEVLSLTKPLFMPHLTEAPKSTTIHPPSNCTSLVGTAIGSDVTQLTRQQTDKSRQEHA